MLGETRGAKTEQPSQARPRSVILHRDHQVHRAAEVGLTAPFPPLMLSSAPSGKPMAAGLAPAAQGPWRRRRSAIEARETGHGQLRIAVGKGPRGAAERRAAAARSSRSARDRVSTEDAIFNILTSSTEPSKLLASTLTR